MDGEVAEESTYVWTHKARSAVFISGMRHFRDALGRDGIDVDYTQLDTLPTVGEPRGLGEALRASLTRATAEGRPPEVCVP